MDDAPPERDFALGYDAGRAMCLATSRESARAHQAVREAEQTGAFWEGWSWAVWDYEDANGLPHVTSA
ncbi:hypothetical protein [Nocardioides mangrovicus]|nr:hypothetical protein [Nocardioides mangrovicus]